MRWQSVAVHLAAYLISLRSVASHMNQPPQYMTWTVSAGHDGTGATGAPSSYIVRNDAGHWKAPGITSHRHEGGTEQPLGTSCRSIQFSFPKGTNREATESKSRASAIKLAYVEAWDQYAADAFGKDTLLPLSHHGLDDFYA